VIPRKTDKFTSVGRYFATDKIKNMKIEVTGIAPDAACPKYLTKSVTPAIASNEAKISKAPMVYSSTTDFVKIFIF